MALLPLFLFLQMTNPASVLPSLQDRDTLDADFVELESSARVQHWGEVARLAERTLRDLKDFIRAAQIPELTDEEKDLSGALAHLRDIQESASVSAEAETRRDSKDLDKEYHRLKERAKKGPETVNLTAVDSGMSALKDAIDSRDWEKARSLAAEVSKALRSAYPPAALDPTREKLGACETHLEDVRDAAEKKIGVEVEADTKRAKGDWESFRSQMVK
jgi:hypothetical protein